MKRPGRLAAVLHCHLPFVRHPEHPDFLEEDWLYEAISETYIPLLDMARRLERDGIPFCLNLSVTPPLAEMLADPLLGTRCLRGLDDRLAFLAKERERVDYRFAPAVEMYERHFRTGRDLFAGEAKGNLISLFASLGRSGSFEILTSAATHGFLPLMATDRARRAQIRVGVDCYRKHFGRDPEGIWLPECAYLPGYEEFLAEFGLRYAILEAHGLLHGVPQPRRGVYAPVRAPNGVVFFGRDGESSRQVWSREEGYPGDYRYREFYRDLGYDGAYDQVRPLLGGAGIRKYLGLKYYRITGRVDLAEKEPYVPDWAFRAAEEHADHFLRRRVEQVERLRGQLGGDPIIVAAFDAELFGHWWFEGPYFLERLIRKAHEEGTIRFTALGEALGADRAIETIRPEGSSWGEKGYFDVWLRGVNDWIYRHLHNAERRMIVLAERHVAAEGSIRRALDQAARELLLAQSSDWAFLLAMGTASVYAEKRTRDHVRRFLSLAEMIDAGRIDEERLARIESMDNIFSEIDYRIYAEGRPGAPQAGGGRSSGGSRDEGGRR